MKSGQNLCLLSMKNAHQYVFCPLLSVSVRVKPGKTVDFSLYTDLGCDGIAVYV